MIVETNEKRALFEEESCCKLLSSRAFSFLSPSPLSSPIMSAPSNNDGQAASSASAAAVAPPVVAAAPGAAVAIPVPLSVFEAQQAQLARLLSYAEGGLKVQMQKDTELAERESKAARKAEADKAEAARLARQEASSNQLRMLKNPASKEKLGWMVTICSTEDAGDRALLAGAMVEATQMLEDAPEDRDDANATIEAATKKTTLSKERQEDMLKQLKIRKRAASAVGAGGQCTRCARDHPRADCVATLHSITGLPCIGEPTAEALAKYQRRYGPGRGYAGPRETYAAAGHAPAAFYQPAMMQQPYQQPPAMMQQPYQQQPAMPFGGAGGYGAPRGTCRACGVQGHYAAECPNRQQQMNQMNQMNRLPLAPAQQQNAAAVSERMMNDTAHGARSMNTNTDTMMIDDGCRLPRDNAEKEEPDTTHAIVASVEREEESLASMYAEKGKPVLDPADNKSEEHNQHADHSASEHTRDATPSSLPEQLIASLQPTGMPALDTSLHRAILKHFAGKKKLLHENEIAGQACRLCGKTGHTQGGCPDQTQSVEEDKTVADRWVRGLMERPRVRIAEENRGLSLEEGVKRWLERGKIANERNPWA